MNKKAHALVLRIATVLALVAYLCVSMAITAASEFKIITLQHRLAEDILPTIQPLLTDNGTASAMQNHLLIRTSAENMAEIEQIIATLDVPRQNLKITVRRQNMLDASTRDTDISVKKRIGNLEISSDSYPSNVKNGVRIQLEEKQSRSQSHADQFINTSDGERAFIRVGQSVPFTQEWITLARHHIHVQKATEFADIDTGFAVRARSIGDQIELELTPRFRQINQNGYIDFEEYSTIIRVTRGQWVDLSAIMSRKDEVSRAILNWENRRQLQDGRLSVRVD